MTPTYQDVISLLRRYDVLVMWTDADICMQLDRSIADNCLVYELDDDLNLSSICLGFWHDTCSLHITAIAGPHGSLKRYLTYLKTNFPYAKTITAQRKGKLKIFNIK